MAARLTGQAREIKPRRFARLESTPNQRDGTILTMIGSPLWITRGQDVDIIASAIFLIVLFAVVSLTAVTLNREAAAIRAALAGEHGFGLAVAMRVGVRAPVAARLFPGPARRPRRAAV